MLRSIIDPEGEAWEVVRGSESYGMMVALFCRCSDSQVYKSYLEAATPLDADREIDESSDQALLQRLEEAQPGP